jgi:hypothetical protein
MRREILVAVAAGVLGALLLVAAWRGSVLGVTLGILFSPLPLAMATFGLGLAALPVAVMSGAVTVTVLTGSLALAGVYLVVDAMPVAILARIGLAADRQTAETGSPAPADGQALGVAVATLAVAGALAMAAGLVAFPAGTEGLEAALRGRLLQLLNELQPAGAEASRDAMAKAMARALPGAAVWDWAFRAMLSAALAQRLLARDGFARWPTPAYRTLAVPGWYIGGFWVATVAAWLAPGDAGFVAANAAAAWSLPLVLQGLAVVHVAVASFGYGRLALVAFYGVALVAAGASVALIAMLGVMEHFLQLRARLMRRPRDGGE